MAIQETPQAPSVGAAQQVLFHSVVVFHHVFLLFFPACCMCSVCVVTLACCVVMMQKEGTLERSKTEEKDGCGEGRNSDEKLEIVHGESNNHRGE